MTMQISRNYDPSQTNYTERMKEKQVAQRAEKAKEADKEIESEGVGKLSEPQDEYISSKKSGKEPTGLYRVGQDENGNRKIFFDAPSKASRIDEKKQPKVDKNSPKEDTDKKEPKAGKNQQGKPAEICVGNTDKVEQEIKRLKEKKQQLKQQLQSASEDEEKVKELEKKLAQVEQELSQKDNDAYRRQNTVFS